MTKLLYCRTDGTPFLVDDADYDLCASFRWYYTKNGYPMNEIHIPVHTLLLGSKKGYVVDHINRNKLDNTRQNLRFVTKQINALNSTKLLLREDRNIYFCANRWQVKFQRNQSSVYVGSYETKEEARRVRDEFLVKESLDPNVKFV